MNDLKNINWKRISVEAIAIVISILLAFSIDAWWDEKQNTADERVLLESLLADLKNGKIRLKNDRRFNGAIRDAVVSLINAGNDTESKLTANEIDKLIGDTWWYNIGNEWDSVSLRAILAGNGTIVSNSDLLKTLEQLDQEISRIRVLYEIDATFHHMTYTPYLINNTYLPQIIQQVEHYPGKPELKYPQPHFELSLQQDHRQLIKRKDFQNMMVAKLDRMLDILNNAHRDIDKELNDSIVMLEAELKE